MSKKEKQGTVQTQASKVITGKCRASYANLNEPKSINGGKPKYSVSIIIPKSDIDTLNKIRSAIKAAYVEGEHKLKGKAKTAPPMNSLKCPLRDGDTARPDDEAYADSYFINANSDTAPGIIDRNRQPITDTREIYSGIYARFSVNFYAYNTNGNIGIACGLNNVQKLSDGTPLGGRSKAEDDFSDEFEYGDGDDSDLDFLG